MIEHESLLISGEMCDSFWQATAIGRKGFEVAPKHDLFVSCAVDVEHSFFA
jgi:hypothetical protein